MDSLNRELLVVKEVQHHQQFVDADKKKSATAQQYEMMCKTYKQERNGMYHIKSDTYVG